MISDQSNKQHPSIVPAPPPTSIPKPSALPSASSSSPAAVSTSIIQSVTTTSNGQAISTDTSGSSSSSSTSQPSSSSSSRFAPPSQLPLPPSSSSTTALGIRMSPYLSSQPPKSYIHSRSYSSASSDFSDSSSSLPILSSTTQAVQVVIRVRPLLVSTSSADTSSSEQQQHKEAVLVGPALPNKSPLPISNHVIVGGRKRFTFESVLPGTISQSQVYQTYVVDLIDRFLGGLNVTIMTYGQTGSGKTYTMGSSSDFSIIGSEAEGIISRSVQDIFSHIATTTTTETSYSLTATFIEVYNDDLIDLYADKSSPPNTITISDVPSSPSNNRNAPNHNTNNSGSKIKWNNVRHIPISTVAEAMQHLQAGFSRRATATTEMNVSSSRSHAVYTLHLTKRGASAKKDGEWQVVSSSRLYFVDLAGSERLTRTGLAGLRRKEGVSINSGLLALGNVISALAHNSERRQYLALHQQHQQHQQHLVHVPYRDSKLTRLLQDSLGGNSTVLMIVCVSPAEADLAETISALKYANRAARVRTIVSKPNALLPAHETPVSEVDELRELVSKLREELDAVRSGKVPDASKEAENLRHENVLLRRQLEELKEESLRVRVHRDYLANELALIQSEATIKIFSKETISDSVSDVSETDSLVSNVTGIESVVSDTAYSSTSASGRSDAAGSRIPVPKKASGSVSQQRRLSRVHTVPTSTTERAYMSSPPPPHPPSPHQPNHEDPSNSSHHQAQQQHQHQQHHAASTLRKLQVDLREVTLVAQDFMRQTENLQASVNLQEAQMKDVQAELAASKKSLEESEERLRRAQEQLNWTEEYVAGLEGQLELRDSLTQQVENLEQDLANAKAEEAERVALLASLEAKLASSEPAKDLLAQIHTLEVEVAKWKEAAMTAELELAKLEEPYLTDDVSEVGSTVGGPSAVADTSIESSTRDELPGMPPAMGSSRTPSTGSNTAIKQGVSPTPQLTTAVSTVERRRRESQLLKERWAASQKELAIAQAEIKNLEVQTAKLRDRVIELESDKGNGSIVLRRVLQAMNEATAGAAAVPGSDSGSSEEVQKKLQIAEAKLAFIFGEVDIHTDAERELGGGDRRASVSSSHSGSHAAFGSSIGIVNSVMGTLGWRANDGDSKKNLDLAEERIKALMDEAVLLKARIRVLTEDLKMAKAPVNPTDSLALQAELDQSRMSYIGATERVEALEKNEATLLEELAASRKTCDEFEKDLQATRDRLKIILRETAARATPEAGADRGISTTPSTTASATLSVSLEEEKQQLQNEVADLKERLAGIYELRMQLIETASKHYTAEQMMEAKVQLKLVQVEMEKLKAAHAREVEALVEKLGKAEKSAEAARGLSAKWEQTATTAAARVDEMEAALKSYEARLVELRTKYDQAEVAHAERSKEAILKLEAVQAEHDKRAAELSEMEKKLKDVEGTLSESVDAHESFKAMAGKDLDEHKDTIQALLDKIDSQSAKDREYKTEVANLKTVLEEALSKVEQARAVAVKHESTIADLEAKHVAIAKTREIARADSLAARAALEGAVAKIEQERELVKKHEATIAELHDKHAEVTKTREVVLADAQAAQTAQCELERRLRDTTSDLEKERLLTRENELQVAKSRSELQAMEEELKKVKADVIDSTRERDETRAQVDALTKSLDGERGKVAELSAKLQSFEENLKLASSRAVDLEATLKLELSEAQKERDVHKVEAVELGQRLAATQKEVQTQASRLSEITNAYAAASSDLEKLRSEHASLKVAHDAHKDQFSRSVPQPQATETMVSERNELAEQLRKTSGERTLLSLRIKELESAADGASRALLISQREAAELREQCKRLEDAAAASRSVPRQLVMSPSDPPKLKPSELNEQVVRLTSRIRELESQVAYASPSSPVQMARGMSISSQDSSEDSIRSLWKKLAKAEETVKKQSEEKSRLDERNAELVLQIANSRESLQRLQELETTNRQLSTQHSDAKREVNSLRLTVAAERKLTQNVTNELRSVTEAHGKERLELTKQVDSLKHDLRDIEEKLVIAERVRETEALQAKNRLDVAVLEWKTRAESSEAELVKLKAKLQSTEQKVNSLVQQLKEQESVLESLRADASTKDVAKDLAQKLADATVKIAELEKDVASHKTTAENASTLHKQAVADREVVLSKQAAIHEKALESQELTMLEMRAELERVRSELSAFTSITKADKDVMTNEAMADYDAEMAALRKEAAAGVTSHKQARFQLDLSQAGLANAKAQLIREETLTAGLKLELQRSKDELKLRSMQIVELTQKLAKVMGQSDEMKSRLKDAEKDLNRAQSAINERNDRIRSLETELDKEKGKSATTAYLDALESQVVKSQSGTYKESSSEVIKKLKAQLVATKMEKYEIKAELKRLEVAICQFASASGNPKAPAVTKTEEDMKRELEKLQNDCESLESEVVATLATVHLREKEIEELRSTLADVLKTTGRKGSRRSGGKDGTPSADVSLEASLVDGAKIKELEETNAALASRAAVLQADLNAIIAAHQKSSGLIVGPTSSQNTLLSPPGTPNTGRTLFGLRKSTTKTGPSMLELEIERVTCEMRDRETLPILQPTPPASPHFNKVKFMSTAEVQTEPDDWRILNYTQSGYDESRPISPFFESNGAVTSNTLSYNKPSIGTPTSESNLQVGSSPRASTESGGRLGPVPPTRLGDFMSLEKGKRTSSQTGYSSEEPVVSTVLGSSLNAINKTVNNVAAPAGERVVSMNGSVFSTFSTSEYVEQLRRRVAGLEGELGRGRRRMGELQAKVAELEASKTAAETEAKGLRNRIEGNKTLPRTPSPPLLLSAMAQSNNGVSSNNQLFGGPLLSRGSSSPGMGANTSNKKKSLWQSRLTSKQG